MSEILCRLDDKSTGEEPFRDMVPSIINPKVLAYVAKQRALRVTMMMEMHGAPIMDERMRKLMIRWLATMWVDAAVMMAVFERERPEGS